jgi:hypothetical protein
MRPVFVNYRPALARTVVLGVPFALGVLELGHPALLPGESIVEALAPIALWWIALHVAQIPLFALLGVAVLLLVRDLDGRPARISRWAVAVFIVIYPAFDAAVGVASGIMVRTLNSTEPGAAGTLEAGLQALFWGPITGTMALVGSASWLIALFAAALAWRRAGAPLYVVAALALAGLFLGIAHIRPFGPLACLFFLVAAAWIVFRSRGALASFRHATKP